MRIIILFSSVLLLSTSSLFAQENQPIQKEHQLARNRDRVLIDFSFTGWSHKVSSLSTRWYSRGIGLAYLHNFEISKHFDFALGAGIKNYNFYHRSVLTETTHPDTNLRGATFSTFQAINTDSVVVKRNKLSLGYYTFPVEFRYKGKPNEKNRVFKLAVGIHANYRMNVHTKIVVGDLKNKSYNFNNFQKWTFGSHMRIGYHRTALNLETSFASIFEKNYGPTMIPFRIGFTYTILD